jgi:predicted secreted protein
MSITGLIVIFVLAWWMVFFAALPFGVRGQAEMRDVAPGTEPGAPVDPDLKRKALYTTAIAVAVTAAIEIAIALGWLGTIFTPKP